MKQNFTSKSSKAFRTIANKEHKGFNAAVRSVLNVWERENADAELVESIKAAKADGLTAENFTAAFIVEHLDGSNYCKGGIIGVTKKGEFTAKSSWTAGQVIDYVRRANRVRLIAESKANKENK